jgi:hypothetical protein
MRTTIEIADDKLARLRQLAAVRGKRGYSELIDEALEEYFARIRAGDGDFVDPFEGVWSDEDARIVRARIAESRERWR